VKERVEMTIEYRSTEKMGCANVLTKPLQGSQFKAERYDLTNWKEV
jgi:hypothetical protein